MTPEDWAERAVQGYERSGNTFSHRAYLVRTIRDHLETALEVAVAEAEARQLRKLRTFMGLVDAPPEPTFEELLAAWKGRLTRNIEAAQESVARVKEQLVAEEREACAVLAQTAWEGDYGNICGITNVAELIRARGRAGL